jgi:hypothetical protein
MAMVRLSHLANDLLLQHLQFDLQILKEAIQR